MAFNDRLKEARINAGMTQQELGNLLGVAKSTITGYEKGTSEPDVIKIQKMMELLKIDANYLFQDEMQQDIKLNLSENETKYIIKFRSLDEMGKHTVNTVLDVEYNRVQKNTKNIRLNTQTDDNMISIPLVARGKVKGVQHIQVNEKEFEEDMKNLVESKNKDL